ncbi:unnamed protein product [Lepeophtheirus salmonis]|uniref:(salmon louse) hypothetical protein n=3 Tax=Lepeophtheirus salmonis TaxID=72036 RepID=A0A7R8D349_LEPSM|nr:unnamed protein product [Lepeophtheirus salmonis]CAF3013459.1 unnamed protein product [Lepeophtheirus salmonis]
MILLPILWLLNFKCVLSFNINKVISNRNDQFYQVDFNSTSRRAKQVSYEPPKVTTGADIDTSVAFALPLFSVQMPGYHEDPTLTNYVSQAALALTVFSLFVSAGAYFPFLFGLNGPSAIGRSEELSVMSIISDCGEFAVCEAHARPQEFGWMALPFLIFIPGDNNGAKSDSSWQRAANYGKSKIDCYDK